MAEPPPAEVLVVGCGNDLRSDDGAGRVVAHRVQLLVEERGLTDVGVRSVVQLVPELALDIGRAHHVVFVDASIDVDRLTVTPLQPSTSAADAGREPMTPRTPMTPMTPMTHHLGPAALVDLARRYAGEVPEQVTLVAIPVHDLGYGDRLTSPTAEAVELAVDVITRLIAPG